MIQKSERCAVPIIRESKNKRAGCAATGMQNQNQLAPLLNHDRNRTVLNDNSVVRSAKRLKISYDETHLRASHCFLDAGWMHSVVGSDTYTINQIVTSNFTSSWSKSTQPHDTRRPI